MAQSRPVLAPGPAGRSSGPCASRSSQDKNTSAGTRPLYTNRAAQPRWLGPVDGPVYVGIFTLVLATHPATGTSRTPGGGASAGRAGLRGCAGTSRVSSLLLRLTSCFPEKEPELGGRQQTACTSAPKRCSPGQSTQASRGRLGHRRALPGRVALRREASWVTALRVEVGLLRPVPYREGVGPPAGLGSRSRLACWV